MEGIDLGEDFYFGELQLYLGKELENIEQT